MDWKSTFIENLNWSSEISNLEAKTAIAENIAANVKEGETIGFGSGSTSFLAIQAIAKKISQTGLKIKAITTSHEIQLTCIKLGIPTIPILEGKPDWCFDGADEIDPDGGLIKGRGGAMFKEKLVMASAQKTFILADKSKFVKKLGEKFPVPVEIVPLALNAVEESLKNLGANQMKLRPASGKDGPIITENGNFIVDVRFEEIASDHEKAIKAIPGVLDSGLFIGYNPEILTVE